MVTPRYTEGETAGTWQKIQQKSRKKAENYQKVNKNKTNLPEKVNLTTYLILKLRDTFMKSGIVNIVNKFLLRSF